jgi:hypothetical protein
MGMNIWRAKFTSYDGKTVYTANLALEERKHGIATGSLRDLTGPVPVELIPLNGVVNGNQYNVGGSVSALGINLTVTFAPFVFAFTGGAQIVDHGSGQTTDLYVITENVE